MAGARQQVKALRDEIAKARRDAASLRRPESAAGRRLQEVEDQLRRLRTDMEKPDPLLVPETF